MTFCEVTCLLMHHTVICDAEKRREKFMQLLASSISICTEAVCGEQAVVIRQRDVSQSMTT